MIVDPPAVEQDSAHGLGRAEFIVFMSFLTATIAISIDTVLPAFDEIEAEFGLSPSGSNVSLTITVFLAAMGFAMVVWGPLADRYGRKPVMYVSLGLYVIGALIATFAPSFTVFLVGRAIWGAAAAGPRAVGLAIVRDSYSGDLMARIMSLTLAVFLVVPVLAPGLGELLLFAGSWRFTTGVSIVFGAIVAVWLTRVRETMSPENMLPLQLGRVAGAARVVITNRTTVLYTLAATMIYGAFFVWLGSGIQMIGEIYDRPEQFAFIFGANAALMAVLILISERLVSRHGTYPVIVAAIATMLTVAVIYVVWAIGSSGVIGFWWWFAFACILTSMTSASSPLMQSMAMTPMGELAGSASSITGSFTFGVGALLAGIIDRFIENTVTPFGVGFLVYGTVALAAVLAARQPSLGL